MTETAERKREFVAEWRERETMREVKRDAQTWTIEDMDLDKMRVDDPRYEKVRAALDSKIERLTKASHSTPLRLSDACLKSIGLSPVQQEGAA